MACREFFESLATGEADHKTRADRIDQAYPDGQCELESVSFLSPGVVKNSEYVHRFVISPHHVDKDSGKILSTFFNDCSTFGMSCQRSDGSEAPQNVHVRGAAMIEAWNKAHPDTPKPRAYLGVVSAQCGNVRSMVPRADAPEQPQAYDKPVMAIYDTAQDGDLQHVDVCWVKADRDRSTMKLARLELALVFTAVPVLPQEEEPPIAEV